jgi:hypothetical protein
MCYGIERRQRIFVIVIRTGIIDYEIGVLSMFIEEINATLTFAYANPLPLLLHATSILSTDQAKCNAASFPPAHITLVRSS